MRMVRQKVIIADRFHPSTQRCSKCGHIKQKDEKITLEGNRKHRTRHDEYICYRCGAVMVDELCDYRRYCWHWRKNINGVGCTLKLQEPVNVITPELGYGNIGVDGSK